MLKCLHKKVLYAERSGRRYATIGSDYGRQLPGPDRGPGNFVCRENCFHTPAAKYLTKA